MEVLSKNPAPSSQVTGRNLTVSNHSSHPSPANLAGPRPKGILGNVVPLRVNGEEKPKVKALTFI